MFLFWSLAQCEQVLASTKLSEPTIPFQLLLVLIVILFICCFCFWSFVWRCKTTCLYYLKHKIWIRTIVHRTERLFRFRVNYLFYINKLDKSSSSHVAFHFMSKILKYNQCLHFQNIVIALYSQTIKCIFIFWGCQILVVRNRYDFVSVLLILYEI